MLPGQEGEENEKIYHRRYSGSSQHQRGGR